METRRDLLRIVAAAAASGFAAEAAQQAPGGVAEAVERARTVGRQYARQYGNCAQCTIAALQDAVASVPKNRDIFLAGSCLHGGATRTGNANCGGFTGAAIVIGELYGRPRDRFADRQAGALANKLVQEMAGKYEAAYGSVICRDVREKAARNCPEVVGQAAAWAAEIILAQSSAPLVPGPGKR
jgi:hypothetical protein